MTAKRKAAPGKSHRRRAKRFGVAFESVNRFDVFERDGWRCQLCGRTTSRDLIGKIDPRAPTLDHIVPFAAGGAHVWSNLQCACLECNLRKGARPLGQLHMFGMVAHA